MPYVDVNRSACAGCGLCIETCPTDVLRLDKESKAFMAYPEDCQGCFVCQWDCAYEAIRVRIREREASVVSQNVESEEKL
ncbi:MAG: ferredoxin family protein [Deltaproteobacteria bacterium]|nr:ferredoxin family protein [Deltaproteobacteria bacterium]